MRRLAFFLALAIISLNAVAANLNLNNAYHGYQIQSDMDNYLELNFDVNNLVTEDISTEEGVFTKLSFKSGYKTGGVGNPSLPTFNNLIEMPYGSNSAVKVVSYDVKEYSLADLGIKHALAPVQPSYEKNIDPADIKFKFNKAAYSVDSYTEKELVSIRKNGTMRGVDLATLIVSPFQYNPVQKTVKVYSNIKVRVDYNADIAKAQNVKQAEYSPYFSNAYAGVINHKIVNTKDDLTTSPVTYLIVANDGLENNDKLDEFIAWKTQKGFNVIPHYVSSTASVNDIDTWVEGQYNSLNPKPSFLLIVGDMDGAYAVKTETSNTSGTQASDLHYAVMGAVNAGNHVPSIYVGRFSVRTEADLAAQVDKTIWYEKTMFTDGDPSYLENCMGTAGADGDHQATYGNPHIRYAMEHYFNNGSFIYPAYGTAPTINGIPFYDGGAGQDANIIGHINDGVAFYNYTAHGSPTSFADPQITISNVNGLTNNGKYGLIIGNCCLTGTFNNTECFGESWLNAPDKGSIGFIGASESTYWDEDLAMGVGEPTVGDALPANNPDKPGMVDGVMNMDYATQAAVKHVGLLAVDAMNSSKIMYYYNAYHLFGDPSIMPYMGVPQEMEVNHLPTMVPGSSTFEVTAVKGAYVALSDDEGVLHGAALANESGVATVEMEEAFIGGNVHMVVTAQFMKPYFDTIPVAAANGPYLSVVNYDTENSVYGETAKIDLNLKNVGVEPSEEISLTATSTSEYVSDINITSTAIADIDVDGTQIIDDAITFKIANNVPDQENLTIDLVMMDTYSKNTYTKTLNITAKAPVLEAAVAIDGQIVSGESKEFVYTVTNSGHAAVNNAVFTLSEIEGHLTIPVSEQTVATIAGGASVEIPYTVDVAPNLPVATGSTMNLVMAADKDLTGEYSHSIIIGDPTILNEEFEGTFPPADWTNSLWFQSDDGFSGKCAAINYSHDGEAILETPEFSFNASAEISFYWVDKDYYGKGEKTGGHDQTYCEISNDGGTTWNELAVLDAPSHETAFHQEVIDITDYTGSNVKIRWRDVNDGGYSAYGTGLDAVSIEYKPSSIEEGEVAIPKSAVLYQNYPNPFNPTTTIKFFNKMTGNVKLAIFNAKGEMVESLVNGNMTKGFHNVNFNAANFNSGVYFYSLETNNKRFVKKMMLVK